MIIEQRCFDYAEVELSNNLAKNSMRGVALGRENWLHVGSVKSGPKVAAISFDHRILPEVGRTREGLDGDVARAGPAQDVRDRSAHAGALVRLLQVCIFLLSKLSTAPLLVRLAMAAIGALAGTGFYLLSLDFVERRAGFLAALLFTANPLIVTISIVPYRRASC